MSIVTGGQVSLHTMRMLKQIVATSLRISFYIVLTVSLFFCIKKKDYLSSLDFKAIASYVRAYSKAKIYKMFDVKKKPRVDLLYKNSKINNVTSASVMRNRIVNYNVKKLNIFITQLVKIITAVYLISSILIFSIWSFLGKRAKSSKNVKDNRRILNKKEAIKVLRKNNLISNISISGLPLVKDSHTRHLLCIGSTGSGKTTMLYNLLESIIINHNRAIIFDQTGEMISKYYNKDREDIIFSPSNAKSAIWDFISEMKSSQALDAIAEYLFCTKNAKDPVWDNTAKIIFKATIEKAVQEKNASVEMIYKRMTSDTGSLKKYLKGTDAEILLDEENSKTAMSIITHLVSNIAWMKYIRNTNKKAYKFNISKWVMSNKDSWMFILSDPATRSYMQHLAGIFAELLSINLMGKILDKTTWIIIDELAALGRLSRLTKALSEMRKYNVAISCCLQSTSQLSSLYGTYDARVIMEQFMTKFFFSNNASNIQDILNASFGYIDMIEKNESLSFGQHEMRDGVQLSSNRKRKPLISTDDLAALEPLECYISLPTSNVSAVKMRVDRI